MDIKEILNQKRDEMIANKFKSAQEEQTPPAPEEEKKD